MIEEALVNLMITDTTIAALTTRCFPGTIPQRPTFPLIVYTLITGHRENHLQGPSGLANPRFQIEAWADTYDETKSLSAAIRTRLNGYRGTVLTERIGSCLIVGERYAYESTVPCHRIIQDYSIWHDET